MRSRTGKPGGSHPSEPHKFSIGRLGLESPMRLSTSAPKQSKVASPGNRLHRLGHRKVTILLKTGWFTPAGLCISTRKFGAFASCPTSLVAKPRDALDTHRHPKRFKLGSKAQNHGTTPKHVPCSETLQKRHFRVFVPPRGFGEKRQWQ